VKVSYDKSLAIKLLLVLGIVVLASASLQRYLGGEAIRGVQEKRLAIESEVGKHIRIGADRDEVLAFLASKAISHTGYESADGDPTALAVMGAPAIIEGRIPVRTLSLTQYSIHITFRFDHQGRFTGISDKVEGTFY
jgi:hypothetical protein